jgi:transketolase C-terminal domain/subunit
MVFRLLDTPRAVVTLAKHAIYGDLGGDVWNLVRALCVICHSAQ